MASSSSSSSRVPQINNDVFISFRGSDIRHGFLSHLTRGLRHKQIDVYVDERLERGDEISSSLLKAIEASEISLIIFSKHYAFSKWCLEELVKVMECKEANGQIVIPVFYNIDPSHVRHQEATYGDAFVKHEEMFKNNMEKLQIWRSTLTKASNLSGYHYSSNFENESELIDEIVQDVLKKLDDTCPIERKRLIGFNRNFACVEELLKMKSQEVLILGIWGMGGIGKTTLARAVCENFSSQFESCCFLENVREESKQVNGLHYLLEKLLFKLLDGKNINMNDAVNARSIRRRLHRKKVLIVLDDVDSSQQLAYLIKEHRCLGAGSRVIVTSRDRHVLISGGAQAVYEVKMLNSEKSLELFSLNAFKQSYPEVGYEELSKRAIEHAKGIPLALEVLGSHLYSRNMEAWESALKKLQKYPHVQIQNVLKVSFDGLDNVEKDIFLDIAFFFKGEDKDCVTRVLDACGFYAVSGIDSLLNKALIKISVGNQIQMHDLVQEMGEQIVREQSIKNPGRRTRLKDVEEIYDVLKYKTGTNAVEGIILDVSQIKNIGLSFDAFKNMTNLRILKFYEGQCRNTSNVSLPFGLDSFSNRLRYFKWDGYPFRSMPLDFCAEKLVELHMNRSKVRKLWDGVQDLVNLKKLTLINCQQLIELPDFSMARNLEKVHLWSCHSLCRLHSSMLSLHSLVSLNLIKCIKLKRLQSESHLKSLQDLQVIERSSLKEFLLSSERISNINFSDVPIEIFHSSIGRCNHLRKLDLNGSRLKSLPIYGLSCLTSLEAFSLTDFRQVIGKMELHSLFDGLHSLRRLILEGCDKLAEIPDNISALTLLEELSLRRSSLESLPASIECLSKLKYISLSNCRRLRSIQGLPPFIVKLDATDCTSLETVCTPTTMSKSVRYNFSFRNCVKLDEHSVCKVEEYTHHSMVAAAILKDSGTRYFCYPGSRVPKWIRYINHTEKASITIEVAPPFHQLLGLFCCFVFPGFASVKPIGIRCEYSSKEASDCFIQFPPFPNEMMDLASDHVFLCYLKCYHKYHRNLLKNDETNYDNGITPKLTFEFVLRYYKYPYWRWPRMDVELDGMLKAWGVSPIYASDYDDMLSEMEMEMGKTTKKRAVIKDEEQLHPTKKSKESCMVPHVPH